jgi:rubredoxin
MEKTHLCPDCRVEMAGGFIPDHYAQTIRSHWHPGTGTEKTFLGNLKLDSALMIPIIAFRCPDCGLLKQYASKHNDVA